MKGKVYPSFHLQWWQTNKQFLILIAIQYISDYNSRRSGTLEIPNSRSTDETAREIKLKLSGKVIGGKRDIDERKININF